MFLGLKIALQSLAAYKTRAVLAMLGVFLGALALTGVQHVSQAMLRKAEIETDKLGPNLFMARSGQISFRREGTARARGATTTFKLADARDLTQGLPSVLDGAPFVSTNMAVRAGARKVNSTLVASWPSYREVRSFNPEFGRFYSWQDLENREKVVLLGRKIAERLFGSPEAAMGQTVFFFRAGFKVIGVMEAKGRDLSGDDQDEQVLMPLSTYMRRAANQDWISGVYLQLAPGADVDRIKTAASLILRRNHTIAPGEKDDFSLITSRETMQLQRQALDLVQTLGIISSSLSFAVGGLGILSIMVLMVRMRRVEIGIRRALGARRSDIVRQFLFEAALMSGMGGVCGVLASLGLVSIVYTLGDFPFVFDPLLIISASLGSALLGVAAGAYPATVAAAVGILDILRSGE